MKKVYSAPDPLQTQLVLGILQQNGIPVVIQGEALWTARGELPLTTDSAPSIWVANDEDAQRALALIEEHVEPLNPTNCANCGYNLHGLITPRCPECGTPFRMTKSWTCPTCGKMIEGQFTECWKCGTSRPEG